MRPQPRQPSARQHPAHTARFPGWPRKPQARPVNVRNDGAVNSGENTASSVISDAGTGSTASGSIRRGDPFRRGVPGHGRHAGHHGNRAADTRPADQERRKPPGSPPASPEAGPASASRRHLARQLLLRRREAARPPTAHPVPAPALAGLPDEWPSASTRPPPGSTAKTSSPGPSARSPARPSRESTRPSPSTQARPPGSKDAVPPTVKLRKSR
jgi:hypothetical protein